MRGGPRYRRRPGSLERGLDLARVAVADRLVGPQNDVQYVARMLGSQNGLLVAADASNEVSRAGLDDRTRIRLRRGHARPEIATGRPGIEEVDVRCGRRVEGIAGQADRPAAEMDLQVRRLGRRHGEAGEHLPERSGGELQVHQNVVGGRDVDGATGQWPGDHSPPWNGDRAHRLDTAHRTEDRGHLVKPVDAEVEDRADLRAVEDGRVAGVQVPARGAE